jgi:hypothetical protein
VYLGILVEVAAESEVTAPEERAVVVKITIR